MNNKTAIAVCTLLSSLSGLVGHGIGYHDTRAEAVKALEVASNSGFGSDEFGRLFPHFRRDDDKTPDDNHVVIPQKTERKRPVLSYLGKLAQGLLGYAFLPQIGSQCVFALCGTAAFCSIIWLVGNVIKVRK